ncbi:MAG: glycosyltransferase [Leptolyngbyaceae cyanobacterium bins.302]|nr:glycosyltransferase [Leptolyngbyaceae cyanobacterium bins.302]
MKSIIVGNANKKTDKISAAQLDPFFRNRQLLRRELGLTFTHIQAVSITEIKQACQNINADVEILFVRPDWRESADEVVQTMKTIHTANPGRKIFFIDPWDQVSSRFFGVLPYVDKLLKYQRLKDVQQYKKPLLGGTMITDYLVREQGKDIYDWHVGSPVPNGYEDRIGTGWNVVTLRQFETLLFKPLSWKLSNRQFRRKPKDVDVFCHLSYSSIHDKESWYTEYRMASVEAVKQMGSKYRLAVSGEFPEARTVSSKQYRDEIERSRIVFSPFGWGETTWRDYEAVCYDSLLLKPNMDHIDTAPNIYYPNETYVPLKWDFSDLEEKCDFYLRNPDEAARIITNARRVLEGYFKQGEFVKTIADLVIDKKTRTPVTAPLTSQQPATSPVG